MATGAILLTWINQIQGMDKKSHLLCYMVFITHPRPNLNGGLNKPPLKLGHGSEITFHFE